MTRAEDTMIDLHEDNGVSLYEYKPSHFPSWIGVTEGYPAVQRYQVTFYASEHGYVSVGLNAQIFDDRPGELANYTSEHHPRCTSADELWISDDGVLTVLEKAQSAACVDFRHGYVIRLPRQFVKPVRQAIAIAWHMAAERASENRGD